MANLSRRGFFGLGAAGALAAGCVTNPKEGWTPAAVEADFLHGVASGDADATSAVLWTRVTPVGEAGAFDVQVLVTADRSKLDAVDLTSADPIGEAGVEKVIIASTNAERDYTVKVIAGDDGASALAPATQYHYAFIVLTPSGPKMSPVGSFKTLPASGKAPFSFAFVSCSNLPFGYFNAYDDIAKRDDVDALIHLGDYIYEYGRDGYGGDVGAKLGREVEPAHEIVKLDDYRTRYAQYRMDPALQAAHAACAWYLSWDDHESTNNSYRTGAQNHQPDTEGDWSERKVQAVQAYLEWMPVREPEAGKPVGAIYRSFEIGDLATLFMLETRLIGRSDELNYNPAFEAAPEARQATVMGILGEAASAERTMLGPQQEAWLSDGFKASTAAGKTWQVLGNQVIMAKVAAPNMADALTAEQKDALYAKSPYVQPYIEMSRYGLPLNLDAWDGFVAARERLYDSAKAAGARLVTLAGDTHTAWANELHDLNGERRGVEFGCTSVTSPGLGTNIPFPEINEMMAAKNKDVVYFDAFGHGYTVVKLTEADVSADYVKVSDILTPAYESASSAVFKADATEAGVSALKKV